MSDIYTSADIHYRKQGTDAANIIVHGCLSATCILFPTAGVPWPAGQLDNITLSSDQNNYPLPPGGHGYRVNVTSDVDITGFAAGTDGQAILIFNVSTDKKKIKLKHDSNSSSISNRYFGGDESDGQIEAYESEWIRYDSSLNGGNGAWHRIGHHR